MRELYINGFLIDLYPRDAEPIATSYQISSIGEFEDVQANFSNTFTVPKTENNVSRLGNAEQVSTNSFVPYRKNPARYINNGIDITPNAFAIIEDAGDDYSITILSGNFDIFAQIGDRKLNDIDASELDHEYTLAEVLSINEEDGDVIWPLVQLGGYGNNGTIDIRWQMPAIKHSYLFRKIFEGTTWGFGGAIFSEEKYSKLLVEMLANDVVDEQSVLDAKSARLGNNTFSFPLRPANNGWYSVLANNRFDIITGDNYDSTAGYLDRSDANLFKYVAYEDVILDIELNLFFNYDGFSNVYIFKNAPFPYLSTTPPVYSTFQKVPTGQNSFNQTVSGIRLSAGDNLIIATTGSSKDAPISNYYADGAIVGDPSNKSYIKITAVKTSTIGGTVHYNALLPEMKQSDFVKNMCNKFGLLMQPNYKTNKIEFKQHKTIRESNVVVDWSDKIDTSVTPKVKFRNNSFGQQTFLRWGQEDERASTGDGFFNIDDTVLNYKEDLFVLEFNSSLSYLINDVNGFIANGVDIKRFTQTKASNYNSQTVYNEGDIVLYNKIVYEYYISTSSSGTVPTDTSKWRVYAFQFEQTEDSSNRLLYYQTRGSFYITDGIGNTTASPISWPVAYFADPTMPFDLDFTNIITREYTPFVAMMQQYKESAVNIRLNEIDIQNLDFFKMVGIESLGNKFYLMLVDEYESDEPSTTCTLIRI